MEEEITFHITILIYAHLMFRILFKKILLTIQFVFFLLIYKTKLVLLGVSYTLVVVHHPINFYDVVVYYSGVGLEPAKNTIVGRKVALIS